VYAFEVQDACTERPKWPYTYDACDVGTAPNQTHEGLPLQATINGDPSENGALSYLPGQRLSRCTCPGESHPGPLHADGTFVGRSAPEIDVFEALVSSTDDQPPTGYVSQSAQWGVSVELLNSQNPGSSLRQPFNAEYAWFNTTDNLIIPNPDKTVYNTYTGGAFQQATSCVTSTSKPRFVARVDMVDLTEYRSRMLRAVWWMPVSVWLRVQAWIRQCCMCTSSNECLDKQF
jgi:beta-glucanase (GH16 family)